MTGIWQKEGCREVCMCSWRDEDRGGGGGERGEIPGLSVTPCGHLSALLFSSSFHPVPVTFTGRPQQRWWMESETGERTKIRVRETDEKWQTHGEENRKRERTRKSRIKLNIGFKINTFMQTKLIKKYLNYLSIICFYIYCFTWNISRCFSLQNIYVVFPVSFHVVLIHFMPNLFICTHFSLGLYLLNATFHYIFKNFFL